MWAKRSEMLAPLSDLVGECGETKTTKKNKTKKSPWRWDPIHQKAFDDVKATIAKEVVLAYPDFSKPFEIYTDASTKQLGAVITQDNRPIAFFSRKLSITQTKYSVTEIELLAIVETLKEFKGMLWGQSIKVYTDHKNLTRDALGLTSDRVHRWRLLLEEYAPEIVYIKGVHNTVADAISRLDYDPTLNSTNEYTHATVRVPTAEPSTNPNKWKTFSKHWRRYNECHATTDTTDVQMDAVFANRSEEEEIYPLTTVEIAQAQRADATYKHLFKRNAVIDQGLEIKLIENTLCVCKDGWLVIPKPLQRRAWLEMSASCRGFFPPKTTDMPTCRRCVADTTQTMSATLPSVGSSDAVFVSCRHDNLPTCRQETTKSTIVRYDIMQQSMKPQKRHPPWQSRTPSLAAWLL
jgi:hypothetical protein